MYDQNDCCEVTNDVRDSRPYPEARFEVNTRTPLTSHDSRLLARQAGQLLVVIGSLLASQSTRNERVSRHTGRNLVGIGRKLLSAAKPHCDD